MSALNISIRSSNRERGGFDRATRFKKKKEGGITRRQKVVPQGLGKPLPCKFPTFGIESKILIATCHFSMPVSFGWRVIKGQRWKEWRMKRGREGKIDGRSCLSTLTRFVPPSVNFWLQYQRDTFPCTDTLKPTTTSGKTEDVSVTTAFPIRPCIFPTSYFVSFLSLSFFFFISFTSCFSVYFFLLFSFLSFSLFLRLVVLFLPPWKYYEGETASWRNRRREQRGA